MAAPSYDGTQTAVRSSTLTIQPHNTFARAIELFLCEVQRKEDVKSPFYKEVMSGLSQILQEDCSSEQTSKCAQRFSTFVRSLDSGHRSESKLRPISERLRPLIDGLTQFTGAFDVLIQTAPAAAQVLYGSARIVLQVSYLFVNT